jgi:Tetratricopeptide repeat
LTSMGNLASTLWNQGDLPGARRLQEAVLEIAKRVLGEEHTDTLTSMNNLAVTLWQQGETVGARRLQEASVQGRLRTLGAQHPDTMRGIQTLRQMGGDSPIEAG